MKIRSLELENFRKFERPVRLAGFDDGVNVLCGPNEFGKSTILAAIRGVLFEKHNSKAEPIKRMQSWRGNAAPRIALEFALPDGIWRIEKRFLHREPQAVLTAPSGAKWEGDPAEEELQRLLGFQPAGKQGARPEHIGLWGALWVTQRASFDQPDLSSDLARNTIAGCLDAEVGALTGGERGQKLLAAVRAQLGEYLDGRGNPKGRFKDSRERLKETEDRLVDLRARERALAEDVEALRRTDALLARESDADVAARAEADLADARARREAALRFEDRYRGAQAELDAARQAVEAATRERDARAARAEALSAARAGLEAARAAELDARERLHAADEAAATGREALRKAEAAEGEAGAALRRARQVLELIRQQAALERYEQQFQRAETAQAVVNGLAAQLAAARLDRAGIEAIRKAAQDEQRYRAALQAQATQLDFALAPGAAAKVRIAGAPAPERGALSVVTDTEIEIEGIGRFHVRPVIKDRDKLLGQLDRAAAKLRTALAEAGCETAEAAEAAFAAREALERRLEEARNALARQAPGDPANGLAPGADALRAQVDVLRRRIEAELAALDLAALPSPAQAEAAERTALEAETRVAEALTAARGALEAGLRRQSEAREALGRAEEKTKGAAAEAARLEREAQQSEAAESGEALHARLAQAAENADRCRLALETLERDRPQDTEAAMQARIQRLEQSIRNRHDTIRKLKVAQAELRARIGEAGGTGLDEQIALAERQSEELKQIIAHCGREVSVLTLLQKTLAAAEQEAKDRYRAPVVSRITPYLRGLFPDAALELDDGFQITAITRATREQEPFAVLSDGTQEQIAVLTRLAFADLLRDQGRPAMLILDDALAWSDTERMERMFDILTQAGQRMQIIVLTCRTDLFGRLGGHRLTLETQPVPA